MRTTSDTLEAREALMDDIFVKVRSSSNEQMSALAEKADANSGGIIAFTDVVEVCRAAGYAIPNRD